MEHGCRPYVGCGAEPGGDAAGGASPFVVGGTVGFDVGVSGAECGTELPGAVLDRPEPDGEAGEGHVKATFPRGVRGGGAGVLVHGSVPGELGRVDELLPAGLLVAGLPLENSVG